MNAFTQFKNEIKSELKVLASEISTFKSYRPENRRPSGMSIYDIDGKIRSLSWDFRHLHIAYCQVFFNTPYEAIEQPRETNKPAQWKIDEHTKKLLAKIEELKNAA